MFSADLGGAPPAATPAATDPPFQKVALLLHGDGTNGAQNNTFVDSSTNNFTITRTGNVAQGTFSPFSLADGQWSNYFDGTGDYLSAPSNSALALGTGDFTVEGWVYATSAPSDVGIFESRTDGLTTTTNGFTLTAFSSSVIRIYSAGVLIASSGTVYINTWCHVAVVRASGTWTLYINGVSQGTSTASRDMTNSDAIIGAGRYLNTSTPNKFFPGYISNFRIVKGTSVYTANFTPPTAPLTAISGTSLLTCQSNRFKDNSSNNFTITRNGDTKVTAFSPFAPSAAYSASTNGGSGYFDGTSDYLTIPSTSAFAFGTADATIEFWVYPTKAMSSGYVFDLRYIGGVSSYLYYNNGSTTFEFAFGGYVPAAISVGNSGLNTWTHFAIVRSSGTVTLYRNGISISSGSGSSSMAATGCILGTRFTLDTDSFGGYISNFRIINSTAVYTANFTPPTAPLTAVANTQLLLNCTNAGIYDNAGKNDIETVGNAQISTSVKKYGTGSMYFDGSGDYLLNQGNIDSFTFGTGDFTIEGWFSFSSLVSGGTFVDFRPFGGNGVYPVISYNSTYGITYFVNGSNVINSNLTPTVGTWYHIAISRSGSSTKMFINGVQYGSTWTDTTNYIVGGRGPVIGVNAFNTSLAFNGYIDDLRITKGQALYTANFTPPTQAFTNV